MEKENRGREKRKSIALNINDLFYVDVTLCTEVDADNNCTEWTSYQNTWVFSIAELLEYYWDYNNNGLKLMQMRLYPCEINPAGTGNYCRNADGSPIVSSKTVIPA